MSFKAKWGYFIALLVLVFNVQAREFNVGETVFVGIPSATIRDDAFIVGQVTQRLDDGDYQIRVEDYVRGHDYGSFCRPVAVVEGDSYYGKGWELWEDTTNLHHPKLEYVVSQASVMPYRTGQYHYIERNNNWIVFGRWMSDAPILAVERLRRAQNDAPQFGLEGLVPAYDLAILHRYAFYEDGWGRPYWPYETPEKINTYLDQVIELLAEDDELNALWRAQLRDRDRETIDSDMRTHFLIAALDKLVNDAYYQLYEDLSKADQGEVEKMQQKLAKLGKTKR